MESQNKVMTVSYGTFSCTLDGFDDPFTTMQLVAEYFRKLASQDRYFGGEPLQPDHNALHQIAQEANPYKVDAEVTDTGITLRKADIVDAPSTEAVESNAPAPEPVAEEPAPAPMFISKRTAPKPIEDAVAKVDAEVEKPEDADADVSNTDSASAPEVAETFVEVAVFSSRRGELTSAPSEPEKPAAEILRDEDLDDDDQAELDAITAEIAETIEERVGKTAPEENAEENVSEQSIKTDAVDDIQREEEALERLLETTNSKLENPAHARKSNALERLKAAVAATEAERRLRSEPGRTSRPKVQDLSGDPAEFKSRMGEMRRKQEEIVKISRPVAKKTGQRARGAFATLILGNDQRVGTSDAAEAAVTGKKPEAEGQSGAQSTQRTKPALKIVRPETETPVVMPAKTGFSGFAEKIGAGIAKLISMGI